jgi:hypothetical protein
MTESGKPHGSSFKYELPKVDAPLALLASQDRTTLDMADEWFEPRVVAGRAAPDSRPVVGQETPRRRSG